MKELEPGPDCNGFGEVSRSTFLEGGQGRQWRGVGMHESCMGNEEGRGSSLGTLLDVQGKNISLLRLDLLPGKPPCALPGVGAQ